MRLAAAHLEQRVLQVRRQRGALRESEVHVGAEVEFAQHGPRLVRVEVVAQRGQRFGLEGRRGLHGLDAMHRAFGEVAVGGAPGEVRVRLAAHDAQIARADRASGLPPRVGMRMLPCARQPRVVERVPRSHALRRVGLKHLRQQVAEVVREVRRGRRRQFPALNDFKRLPDGRARRRHAREQCPEQHTARPDVRGDAIALPRHHFGRLEEPRARHRVQAPTAVAGGPHARRQAEVQEHELWILRRAVANHDVRRLYVSVRDRRVLSVQEGQRRQELAHERGDDRIVERFERSEVVEEGAASVPVRHDAHVHHAVSAEALLERGLHARDARVPPTHLNEAVKLLAHAPAQNLTSQVDRLHRHFAVRRIARGGSVHVTVLAVAQHLAQLVRLLQPARRSHLARWHLVQHCQPAQPARLRGERSPHVFAGHREV
mmetsp:Transcript_13321/g.55802  ORF Transcript_13321/g.55802 Transcript_13321/m.55802 type:complete len:431 (-) Transcript_13321:809-2101(-)